MNLPGFTADASIYTAIRHYRATASQTQALPFTDAIVPAYFPGPETQARCSACLETCANTNATCSAAAMAPLFGCFFPPACPAAAALAGKLLEGCQLAQMTCSGYCVMPGLPWSKCCPKICGFPNPFEPGEGCCDVGEHCVDRSDPNARQGCCPSDRNACGDHCCDKGDRCCGNECCPASWHCINNTCTQFPGFGTGGPPPTTPPYSDFCLAGWTPCNGKCCPPGLECCPGGYCMWTCVK